jgi:hypothetical protein
MPIITQFTPTKEDYISASKTYNNLFIKVLVIAGLIAFEIFMGISSLHAPGLSTRADWSTPLCLPLTGPVFGFVVLFISPLFYIQRIKEYIKKDEQLTTSVIWLFDEEEIKVKNEISETTYDWRAFHKGFEVKDYYLLQHFANKRKYSFIPKRAFASLDQKKDFSSIVERKLGKLKNKTFEVKVLMPLIDYIGFCALVLLDLIFTIALLKIIIN